MKMRKESREMSCQWALDVLRKAPYITVSFTDADGRAYGLPLSLAAACPPDADKTEAWVKEVSPEAPLEGAVWYFHGAQEGKKLDAIKAHPEVCLSAVTRCTPTVGPKDGSFTLQFKSALAFGRAELVTDEAERVHAMRVICERYLPQHMAAFDESIARSLPHTAVVRITLTEPPTGKRKQYDQNGDEMKWQREAVSERAAAVLNYLKAKGIPFSCYNHPEGKSIEEAKRWWKDDGSIHCKNIFMRNHKGNQHYLICFHCDHDLDIHDLEARLKATLQAQGKPSCGKLSFASAERMMKYLGLEPGSVSPFGLINDEAHHVHLFLDATLQEAPALSFHPNDCRGTVVISREDFHRYLTEVGNTYEYIQLY